MEQRRFGNSGLSVSVLSFGTMTIGGRDRFGKMGNLGVAETSRILDICREAGVTTLDTADIYSFGAPRRSSAKRWWAGATTSSWRPRLSCAWAPRRMTSDSRAST